MKRKIRNILGWLLAMSLISSGSCKRAKKESMQNNVITCAYFHHPNKKLFTMIVRWLKNNGYVFISGEQMINILHRKEACPRGAVWVSCDDGWKSNLVNMIPVAEEYNVPITILIYTDAIENGSFWWRDARRYSQLLPPQYRKLKGILRASEEVRKNIIQLMTHEKASKPSLGEPMTIDDIKNIAAMPLVTIGAHTVTHPILPHCDDTQLEYEIGESKRKLESWTGKQVKAFAYPNGFYTGREKRYLKKYGYELAVKIDNKLAGVENDCYALPRTEVMDDGSFAENLCHLLGVWEPMVTGIKRFAKLKLPGR